MRSLTRAALFEHDYVGTDWCPQDIPGLRPSVCAHQTTELLWIVGGYKHQRTNHVSFGQSLTGFDCRVNKLVETSVDRRWPVHTRLHLLTAAQGQTRVDRGDPFAIGTIHHPPSTVGRDDNRTIPM
jgi:hypothetical protein